MLLSTKEPRRHEQAAADVEKWQLEMAQELGVIDEVRVDKVSSGGRYLLRPHHFRLPGLQLDEKKPK